jgi:hypothetical protein
MRESRTFGKRSTSADETRQVKKKYILVFEGDKTEPLYFSALEQVRDKIGISPLIALIPLERTITEEGWSNPKKLLDRLLQVIDESKGFSLSYQTLLEKIRDCLFYSEYLQKRPALINDIWEELEKLCIDKLQIQLADTVSDPKDTIHVILDILEKNRPRLHSLILSHLADAIETRDITYEPEVDTIAFIVDRDRNSFFETEETKQYSYVLQTCRENNIRLYVSNPCFEFWILLHFDEVLEIDKEKLLKNDRISKSPNSECFVQGEIRELFKKHGLGTYKKERYDALQLAARVDTAVRNEKQFCENVEELEHTVGCNIGLLIEDMRSVE